MPTVKLGDVAIEAKETYKGDKTGYPIVGLEHITPEEVTLSNWSVDTENTFTKMFRKDDILFGRRRAYLKKAAIAPFDGICSGDITVIRAKSEKLLPTLLPFVIQNDDFFEYAVGKSAGSLSPRVKWEHLKNYEFNLPSLKKQKELADLLWSINDSRKAYQELLLETDELIKSQFIEMFGDPIQNDRVWPTQPLSEVAPPKSADITIGEKVWLLNLDMIESGTGNIIEKVYVSPDEIGTSTGAFNRHMVLYSKLRPYLNKVVLPDEEGVATNELVPMLPNCNLLRKEFLAALLRGDHFLSYAVHISGGAQMPRMPVKELREFQCILPPVELQDEFIRLVQQSDKSKFELKQAIEGVDNLIRSLVQQELK